MSEFAQRFLNEDWENLPQAPRVYVGAFGKHPAWNDHMDDVGLLTSSLVMLRRSLYGTGIASQIESAAWDRAGADKTLATFDHTLVWRRGRGVVDGPHLVLPRRHRPGSVPHDRGRPHRGTAIRVSRPGGGPRA
jgi:hypothetical protein